MILKVKDKQTDFSLQMCLKFVCHSYFDVHFSFSLHNASIFKMYFFIHVCNVMWIVDIFHPYKKKKIAVSYCVNVLLLLCYCIQWQFTLTNWKYENVNNMYADSDILYVRIQNICLICLFFLHILNIYIHKMCFKMICFQCL